MKILKSCIVGAALILAIPATAAAQPGNRQEQSASRKDAPKPAPQTAANGPYGRWDRSWGARPPAPPKHWTKKGDWHRHVRACQKKYRSYNARTDTFRTSGGKARRCTL